MINIEYYDDLPESLWDQGVIVEDYDYALFIPSDDMKEVPNFLNMDILLTGCCDNTWYYVEEFNGKSGWLGVAYHA